MPRLEGPGGGPSVSPLPAAAIQPTAGRSRRQIKEFPLWRAFHECRYELGGDLRDDRIASGAQLPHSGGNPMSQRENSGLSWPRFSVCALKPFGIAPMAAVCKFSPPFPRVPGPVELVPFWEFP
jgi:hypothetical protein